MQAAIWFFSDRYVLNSSDPVYAATVAIVDKVIEEGPASRTAPAEPHHHSHEPERPAQGSRTVHGEDRCLGGATVNATGANMYANREGTTPIAPGEVVASDTKIWLRSTGTADAVLQATAQATVPSGNVYLYDGNTAGVVDAQKLILAQGDLEDHGQSTAEFLPRG